MADKIPVKAYYAGADVVALGEFEAGDTVPVSQGGTGATNGPSALANLGLSDTDGLSEGSTNLWFTAARVRAAVLTGLSTATNAAVAATDSVLQAFGKLQAQVTDLLSQVGDRLKKDGSEAMTGNLPMGNNKITGLATGTANTDAANLSNVYARTGQAGPATLRNRVINGNFAINQRNGAGTVNLTAGVYGHDRWKAGAGGAGYTFAASGADTTLTIFSGTLQQIIEGSNLEGGTFTLSWTGTAQGKIGGGSLSSSPVSGTVTAGADLTIEFSTGTLGTVQLEAGSVATTFERRPIALEMAMCRRYYQLAQFTVYKGSAGVSFAGSPTNVYFERMRATPTIGSTNRLAGTAVTTTFTPESPTNMLAYYATIPGLDTWTTWQVQLNAEL